MSRDSVASHQKFKAKYGIPFRLLSDTDEAMCKAFGVLVDGKLQRSTFLFDSGGTILNMWPKVSVAGHAEEVYDSLP